MSGGYSESTQSSQTETKTAEQKANLARALEIYAPTLGRNEDVYQGQRVAPLTGLQQGTLTGAGNYADYFSTPQTVGTPLAGQTAMATSGILSGSTGAKPMSDADVTNYFTEKFYNPAMTTLKEDVNPLIDEAHAGPGFFGSARSNARTEAAKDVNSRLAEQWAQLNWDTKLQNQALDEAKAGRTLSAIPQGIAVGQVPAMQARNNLEIAAKQISGLQELFGFGAQEQTQEQKVLEAQITKFMEEAQITDPNNLAIMLSLLGLNFTSSSGKGESMSVNVSS